MLVLVGSLGELLGRQKGRAVGRGVVHHRPPVDLCEPTRLLEEVTAGESDTWAGWVEPDRWAGWVEPDM